MLCKNTKNMLRINSIFIFLYAENKTEKYAKTKKYGPSEDGQ